MRKPTKQPATSKLTPAQWKAKEIQFNIFANGKTELKELKKDLTAQLEQANNIQEQAKRVLKEILQPTIPEKKLSKKEKFDADVEANIQRSLLTEIQKSAKKAKKSK